MDAFLGFSGRISRGQWWLVQLVNFALGVAVMLWTGASLTTNLGNPEDSHAFTVSLVVVVALLIFGVCSTVQRYHDRGKSGLWFFIALVPLVGGIWQLIECGFCSGDDGDNAYGPPPGATRSQISLEREQTALSQSRLSQIDDDYFKKYSSRLVQEEATPIVVAATPAVQSGPVFGKRKF